MDEFEEASMDQEDGEASKALENYYLLLYDRLDVAYHLMLGRPSMADEIAWAKTLILFEDGIHFGPQQHIDFTQLTPSTLMLVHEHLDTKLTKLLGEHWYEEAAVGRLEEQAEPANELAGVSEMVAKLSLGGGPEGGSKHE